ncbi:serine/threonine protein kinase [Candidatus Sumerlaeota bacterium]|nr:serine/threonine protein kinase [Candidatus Sumerlaeota bacterium]
MNTETGLPDNEPGETSPAQSPRPPGSSSGELPKTIGKYRIVRMLGRGGMGMVFEGRDEVLERSVAIKLITPELCLYPEVFDRFRTEARAAARLNHPNIVNVYEFAGDTSQPYLVMEYVEGEDLSSHMKTKGALQPDLVIDIIRQCALALSKATAANLVHRDIKPSNILLTKDGVVKVMDFGLSKLLDSGTSLTSSGAMMGTPDYMSPEQASGAKLDYRTDMYSLGCTMYALLAGKKPYHSESLPGMIHQHINTALPIPVSWRKLYNGRLVALLEKMCAKKRDNRPYTWDEIVRELDSLQAQASAAMAPASSQKNSRWPVGIIAALGAGVLITVVVGGSITYKNVRKRRAERELSASLTTAAKASLETPEVPGAVILGNSDLPRKEQPFILPTPAPQESAPQENREPEPTGLAEEKPPRDAPPEEFAQQRPRREGGRVPQISEQEMSVHKEARQRAIAALTRGDFAAAKEMLDDEMDDEGEPPAPPPVQRVYEGILNLLQETDSIDAKVKGQLKNPNASAAERIAHVHTMVAAEGKQMNDNEAWLTLLYLYLLRDPDMKQMFDSLSTTRVNFGKSPKHMADVRMIDNFFDPSIGFPPQGGNGGQRRPPRPQ